VEKKEVRRRKLMFARIRLYLEMIRFSHTIFALPFALQAAVLAWQSVPFSWWQLLGILLCMITARSAAMAFNRIVDRQIDARNPRTAGRHLPAGKLSLGGVVAFTVASCLGFVASTLLFWPNRWPLYLSVPVLAWLLGYSYAKRFTVLAHFWLGLALALAPLAAWIAIRGLTDLAVPAVLGAVVLFWVAGFDILYACQDAEFDRAARLHSVPAWLGVPAALRLAAGLHLLMLLLLVLLYFVAQPLLGTVYLVGVGLVGGLLVYEHLLVSPNDLTRVNQAFFQVNAVISIGLLALVIVQVAVR
jgi:4-hydroxybenzoate polyprenyltransferase